MFFLPYKLLLPLLFAGSVLGLDTYYTLFPKNSDDTTNNERITRDLHGRIDKAIMYHSQSKYLGTMYWYAPLNAENVARYRSDASVSIGPYPANLFANAYC